MTILVPIFLTSFAYYSVSVLAVGYMLYLAISRKWDSGPYGRSVSFVMAQSVAIGVLYNFYQFLVVLALSQHIVLGRHIVACAKFGMDASVIGIFSMVARKRVTESFRLIMKASQPVDWAIMGAGVLLGAFAMFKFPVVRDCTQFLDTVEFWQGNADPIIHGTGAYGFSALVYFNSLLAGDAAIANSASGLKPFLGFLFALATLAVVEGVRFETNPTGNKILLFLILATSFVFYVGVIQYGKASIFAVVLSVLFIAAILNEECLDYPITASLCMAASAVLGAIAIPFLFLITVMIVVAAMDLARTYRFVKSLIIVAGPPLCVAVSTKMHVSSLLIAALFAAIYVLNFLGSGRASRILRLPIGTRYLPLALCILMMLLGHMLMPLKLPVVYGSSLGAPPLVSFHSPVDGKTTFIEYLLTFSDSTLAVVSSLIGVILVLTMARFEHRRGLRVCALFPFVGTVTVLILGHSGQKVLSNADLWNLIKDIPNWYGGFITGLFALISVNVVCSLTRTHLTRTVVWWCCGTIVAIGVLTSFSYRKSSAYALDFSVFTEGGIAHFDREILKIIQYLPGAGGNDDVCNPSPTSKGVGISLPVSYIRVSAPSSPD